jgi:hypothetical protein
MQRSTTFTTIFRVKELAKSVQTFSSDALTNEQHFIFIYRVYYEKPLVLYFPYFLSDFNKCDTSNTIVLISYFVA